MSMSVAPQLRLDYRPRAWQLQCHRQRKRFSVFALHRRAGKTELAIMELIDKAMKFDHNLGFFVYVAPFLKQAKAIAWSRLKQKLEPLRLTEAIDINESDLQVTFRHNGCIIRLFGGDNPDAMRGLRIDGAVIDEVAQIKPEVWMDILQPALSDRLGWAMFIGTPAGINLFSELYHRSGTTPDWHGARYTVYDTNAINPAEVERLRRDMAEMSFAREYLCDFTAAGDDQLISLSDAEEAARKVYTEGETEHAPRVIGIDPARFGDDRSVIFKRQGLQAFDPMVYRGIDNMALAGIVANVIEQWHPDAVFCDAGAGSGVIDRLRQLEYDVMEVPFGGKALNPQLSVNRRTEMWWLMKEWVEQGGAIPDDIALKQELATPTYWFDSAGRRVLEPKDQIKKRLQGAGSPDLADALALTFAYPVKKRMMRDVYAQAFKKGGNEHDPYSRM
jgi:hypothetical protein